MNKAIEAVLKRKRVPFVESPRDENGDIIHDIVVLECPHCKNTFSVTTYSFATGSEHGIENAPLYSIAEINKESKEGRIRCIHCTCDLALQVLYLPIVRILSTCHDEGWLRI